MKRLLALLALVGCAPEEMPGTLDSAATGSRCQADATSVRCAHETAVMIVSGETREIHWQVPVGEPPAEGWPVVLLFQGSLFSAELSWAGEQGQPYGLLYQARAVHALLDAGYAVITPEAHFDGAGHWDTNVAPWIAAWESAPDHRLMLALFAGIEAGDFGALDAERMYAAGLSSGGYMTSRMGIAYPGRFRAFAIAAASYATCAGWYCAVPSPLREDHPPTLFLHGQVDTIVPVATMRAYARTLAAQGLPHRVVVDATAWHGWISATPVEMLAWFQTH